MLLEAGLGVREEPHYHQRIDTRCKTRFFQTAVPVAVLKKEWKATIIFMITASGLVS